MLNSVQYSTRLTDREVPEPVPERLPESTPLNKYKYKQKQNINNNIKKAPLNNYEDGNKTDFSALDEKIMDMMLGEG